MRYLSSYITRAAPPHSVSEMPRRRREETGDLGEDRGQWVGKVQGGGKRNYEASYLMIARLSDCLKEIWRQKRFHPQSPCSNVGQGGGKVQGRT